MASERRPNATTVSQNTAGSGRGRRIPHGSHEGHAPSSHSRPTGRVGALPRSRGPAIRGAPRCPRDQRRRASTRPKEVAMDSTTHKGSTMVHRLASSRRVRMVGLALALVAEAAVGSSAAATVSRAGLSPLGHAVVFSRFLPGADMGDLYRIDAGARSNNLSAPSSTLPSFRPTARASSTSRPRPTAEDRRPSTTSMGRGTKCCRSRIPRSTFPAERGSEAPGSRRRDGVLTATPAG